MVDLEDMGAQVVSAPDEDVAKMNEIYKHKVDLATKTMHNHEKNMEGIVVEIEIPQGIPTMEQIQSISTEVMTILKWIESLGALLDVKTIIDEVKEMKHQMEVRDTQIFSINKLCLQVLHNSTHSLPPKRLHYE